MSGVSCLEGVAVDKEGDGGVAERFNKADGKSVDAQEGEEMTQRRKIWYRMNCKVAGETSVLIAKEYTSHSL